MLYEAILVKELKTGTIKDSNKTYPVVVDQSGNYWRLFDIQQTVELNKAYTIGFEYSENKQYKNVREIIPLCNVWKQQALKELASKSDICKNVSISVGYAKDLVIGKVIEVQKMYDFADMVYTYISQKVDAEYDKINNLPKPKEVK